MKSNFIHLEYIWLDGNQPQQIRSKTKIVQKSEDRDELYNIYKESSKLLSIWNFDGSSTNQAETSKSELLLRPVNIFVDPLKNNGLLVLCEVLNTDFTPHYSNHRLSLQSLVEKRDQESLFGWEQEYFIYDNVTKKPAGWPSVGYPEPQGDYYCANGGNHVIARDFVEEHTQLCQKAGLEISGINAEVALGQWEYQIGPVPALDGSDQLWISRYLLDRLSEKYNFYIELDPKPYKGNNWNGSGMHVNFSTKIMREDLLNKKELVIEACEKLGTNIEKHISVYGTNNEHRLTGQNETCSINQFRWGIGDRTASIRIPSSILDSTTPGYLEDRRPASNADPYLVSYMMIDTICD
jgi:glutamine synthetase